jgi:acyl-CoA synthetase (AMP-forming)/AMP-acid ligase II
MLSDLLAAQTLPSHRESLVAAGQRITWGQLRDLVASFAGTYQGLAGRRVGLRFVPLISSYALLFALESLDTDLLLLDGRQRPEEATQLARDLRMAALLTADRSQEANAFTVEEFSGEAEGSAEATVTILTSGTTGKPKAVRHTWESLSRPVRRIEGSPAPRWLQTYRPNFYAGLQVLLQCFVNHGTLHIPGEGLGPSEIAKFIAENQVEYISATPSYWRRLLLFADPATLNAICPVQITLGGEVVDQAILDSLTHHFPGARIVHIYATTELGRCFSVTDALQGFPKRFLAAPSSDGVEMRIQNNELLVRSANAMAGYDHSYSGSHVAGSSDGWIATGDLVATEGDRVAFVGRKSDVINVGGNKVHPVEIERILRAVPGVSDVRVYARRSSISGELVACDLVSDKSHPDSELLGTVQETCRAKLAAYQRPRLVKIVDRIELSAAQKTVRGGLANEQHA